MSETTVPTDPQARKAAIREQARKNRIAQKNKDEVSRAICEKFSLVRLKFSCATLDFFEEVRDALCSMPSVD